MTKAIINTVAVFCFFMTMVPLHAEELTEALEARNNKIFGQCMMDHYSQVTDENGNIYFLHIDGKAFVNCLKCKKHTEFISTNDGENCDE